MSREARAGAPYLAGARRRAARPPAAWTCWSADRRAASVACRRPLRPTRCARASTPTRARAPVGKPLNLHKTVSHVTYRAITTIT